MSKGDTNKVVVIATWGLPRLWRYVEYVVPKIPVKVCGRPSDYVFDDNSVRGYSYSSTPTIYDALRRNLSNAEIEVVIVGQDTVVTKCDGVKQGGSSSTSQLSCIDPNNTDYRAKLETDNEVCSLNEDLYNEIIKQQGQISYSEILKHAEEVIRKYADAFLRNRSINYANPIVVPGAGDFSRYGYRFESSLENTKFVLMNRLYEVLKKELPDAVVLDITHGVNYLPAITISALSEVVKALYVMYGRPRCLLIVNSDPVNEDCVTSRINIVDVLDLDREGLTFNEVLRNIGAFEGTAVSIQPKPNVTNIDELRRIRSNDGRIKDLSSKLVNKVGTALEFGALLYVAEKLRSDDFEEFKQLVINAVKDIEELITRKVSINVQGKVVVISRDYAANSDLILQRMGIDALEALRNVIHECSRDGGWYDLDCLSEAIDRLRLPKTAIELFKHEVDTLKEHVNCINLLIDKGKQCWEAPYEYIYKLTVESSPVNLYRLVKNKEINNYIKDCGESSEDAVRCDPNRRNLIAHAGFERTTIHVKYCDNKIFIKYYNKCINKIEQLI